MNFHVSPQQQMGQTASSHQFPPSMMQQSPRQSNPHAYHVTQQNMQNQFQHSNQRPNAPPSNEKPRANPFIPHQVLMKKSTSQRSTDVDNEIKEILGIKTSVTSEKVTEEKPALPLYDNMQLE